MPYCKRKLGCILDKNSCAVKRYNILFALAEINISVCICKDKMIPMLLGIVSACIKGKAVFLFYTENVIKLEELALPLMSRRLTHSYKSAAVIYKALNCGNNLLVCPILSARLCGICIANIDNYINIIKHGFVVFDVVKADKRHIKRSTAQCLNNTEIRIILSVIKSVMHHMI